MGLGVVADVFFLQFCQKKSWIGNVLGTLGDALTLLQL